MTDPIEPTFVSQTVKDPAWREAMASEFNALVANQTWTLVPITNVQNLVGNKWVFKLKRKADSSIKQNKARLVSRGFNQRPDIDFKETFSPVVNPAMIQIVLSIALHHDWEIKQMDVNNAFLQGNIHDEVYMLQPTGFVDKDNPDYVCKLKKAIYGIKQAPRAWYMELSSFLIKFGFTNSTSDASLFVYQHNGETMYFFVYINDLVLAENSKEEIAKFVGKLSARFSFKDLGQLNFFLGVETVFTKTSCS